VTADRLREGLVGINHVALAAEDIDAALEWYGRLFEFDLRGRSSSGAFIDVGDQFIALNETDAASESVDAVRHFGLVVDDLDAVERRLDDEAVERLPTNGCDVRDPWGNRLQLVEYAAVQFTKADHVLDGMDVEFEGLPKTESALAELAEKGMAPD
jgi:catechol 2,3-dioxygenase-like lactoylglutathione lyase family enzyme